MSSYDTTSGIGEFHIGREYECATVGRSMTFRAQTDEEAIKEAIKFDSRCTLTQNNILVAQILDGKVSFKRG